MTRAFLLAASLLVGGAGAHAQVNPAGLKWGAASPALPPGARSTVLSGDPTKPGMYTTRLRFPPGYTIPPHRHPSDELVTVIQGQVSFGMGERMNRARAASLVQGGYVVAKANMAHYAFTRSGATIQVTAHGPSQITYVNPKDDPRKK